jgi:hypothetical protein
MTVWVCMRMQINIAHVRDCAADYFAALDVRALVWASRVTCPESFRGSVGAVRDWGEDEGLRIEDEEGRDSQVHLLVECDELTAMCELTEVHK